jgi:hypothetical protein
MKKNKLFLYWFHVKEAEDAVPLGYDAASLSNQIPTFRGNTVASSSGGRNPLQDVQIKCY